MKNTLRFVLACMFMVHSLSLFAQPSTSTYLNTNASIEDRVDDLVSQMTLEEKAGQLMFTAPAIPRLGVPAYNWWNECLHGVARNGKATVFPQAIGMGATFDVNLMKRIGDAIAIEARAKFNENRKRGYTDRYSGLTFWSPNVNLFRDPRWGRGQETYGEDPFHLGEMGKAFVQGLQGDDDKLKVAAMAKHYAVHSGPEKLRHEFDAKVSKHDLWNTYLPAFRKLVVEAEVEGLMGAYNRTNGYACSAHPYLMDEVLRKKWGFDGYYVSDCWAIQDFYADNGHKLVANKVEAAALALNEGCNLNCGNTYPVLLEAIAAGLTTEEMIDQNLKQLLPTRFRLGLFDPIGSHPMDRLGAKQVRTKEHIALSYEAAVKSLVLLKNKENILPLDPDIQSVFVTGPMATNIQALLANYYGISDDMKTILEGIAGNVGNHTAIRFVQGSLMDRPNVNPMDWYSEEAQVADVTIACMGITQLLEGEEGEAIASPTAGDRDYIHLPPHQIEFLKLMRSKAEKLVVVITGGSAISIPEVYEMADAVIYAWYPGEQGGQAVGDVLFGKAVPSGKLPVSFVNTIDDLPPYEDYDMKGRTYRYMKTEPLFPFGFGLSYANFKYSNISSSSKTLRKNKKVSISVAITNDSKIDAEEVIQLYISDRFPGQHAEKQALKDFKRVALKAGETKTIQFDLDYDDLCYFDENGDKKMKPSTYRVSVGGCAPFQRSLDLGASEWQFIDVDVK